VLHRDPRWDVRGELELREEGKANGVLEGAEVCEDLG
jgi:hypothetical protein